MTKKFQDPLPPTGSFPGYERGAALFNAWARALWEQSNIWNDFWSRMQEKPKDMNYGYDAVIKSAQSVSEAVEGMTRVIVDGSKKASRKGSSRRGTKRGKKGGKRATKAVTARRGRRHKTGRRTRA